MPIAPLLNSLQSMAAAGPLCLVDEVAFLGITALQTPCVDERAALLGIIYRVLNSIPRRGAYDSAATLSSAVPSPSSSILDFRARAWSLEALVYPVVSMAAAGNTSATEVLQPLEAALSDISYHARDGNVGTATAEQVGKDGTNGDASCIKNSRYASTVALGVRRLSSLEGSEQALVSSCEGLQRRAIEFKRPSGMNAGSGWCDSAATAELECGFYLLAPLLLRPRGKRVQRAACATLVAVVRAVPTLGVRLLPFVLYAIRRVEAVAPASGGILALQILPELGAHRVVAKPVAVVIQALAKAPQPAVRGVGLRLAAALIQVNSRYGITLSTLYGS